MTHPLTYLAIALAITYLAGAPLDQAASRQLTNVYLMTMNNGLPSLRKSQPVRIAAGIEYTNDPAFSPDGNCLLFTSNPDGTQLDVFRFDRPTGRVTQLTKTSDSESQPSFLPESMGMEGFSAIVGGAGRGQLTVFDGRGGRRILFDRLTRVTRHAWLDPDLVGLLIDDEPVSTLRLGRPSTGVAEIVASQVEELAVPSSRPRLLSFVHAEPSNATWIDEVDTGSRRLRQLVEPRWRSGSHAWMPDGKTLLMVQGGEIRSWTRGTTAWSSVFDPSPHNLEELSRVAVSPNGDAVAIVAVEVKKK